MIKTGLNFNILADRRSWLLAEPLSATERLLKLSPLRSDNCSIRYGDHKIFVWADNVKAQDGNLSRMLSVFIPGPAICPITRLRVLVVNAYEDQSCVTEAELQIFVPRADLRLAFIRIPSEWLEGGTVLSNPRLAFAVPSASYLSSYQTVVVLHCQKS